MKIATDDNNIYTSLKLHRLSMSTDDIIQFLEETIDRSDMILADCAEPRLIEEIQVAGFNIIACRKGKDSIKNGLARLNEKTIISEDNDTTFVK